MGRVIIKRLLILTTLLLVLLTSSIVAATDTNQSDIYSVDDYQTGQSTIYQKDNYISQEYTNNNYSTSLSYNSTTDVASDNNESSNILTDQSLAASMETNTSIPTSISVERVDAYALTNITINSKISNLDTDDIVNEGSVVFKINGITIGISNVTNNTASITYDISGLSANTYSIYAKYTDGISFSSSNTTSTLKIVKRPIMMSVSNKTVYSYTNATLTATIVDKLMNDYISEGVVVFKLNGITVGTADIINGKANLIYDVSSLSPKNYTISAIYGGSKLSYDKQVIGTLNIIKRASSMTLSYKEVNDEEVIFIASIADKVNHTYVSEGIVTFKLNGITIGASNVTNGKSYFNYNTSNLSSKTYQVSATYSGTKFISENWANTTVTIAFKELKTNENTGYKTADSEINITDTFTYAQIKTAAVNLRNMYESNHIIDEIEVGSYTIPVQDFLALMLQATQNVNKKKSSLNISYKHYDSPTSFNDTVKNAKLYSKELLSLSTEILNYMNTHNRAPECVNTSLGYLGYYNIIYTYTKIMDLSTTTYIPSSIAVYNWYEIHPTNSKDRVIYISTDNIYSKTKDLAFVNKIIEKLKSYGYTAKSIGVGPNTHNTKIWSGTLPINAVQLSIFGGADAGVIYDVCTRSFMRTKANRLVYFAYNPYTAKNITGLSWLERAHDDNYSASSFKGIANPDNTLLSHGYDYIYSYDVDTIVKGLIDYIS